MKKEAGKAIDAIRDDDGTFDSPGRDRQRRSLNARNVRPAQAASLEEAGPSEAKERGDRLFNFG